MRKILCLFFVLCCVGLNAQDNSYWGYHLILDCKACDLDKIKSAEVLREFAIQLVDKIDMKRFGDPIVVHFAEDNPEAAGYSLVQLIETSAITGHFVDQSGDCYIDIFSCKEYDADVAYEFVKEFLGAQNIKRTFLKRQA
jgi:S-adenosylmethionine/arginine decarboxylase-like enzyme